MNTFALFRNTPWKACLFTVLAVLGLIGQSAKAQTQPIFPVATQVGLPVESTPLFIGDFNGDGLPDLAAYTITNNAPATLSILLSFGTNAQTTVTTTFPSGTQTPPMTFADVNNDKKLDLVYYSNGYLTIQLGNGDGTFQSPAYLAISSFSPVLVDLNGDGYLDIAGLVASTQPNTPPQVAVFMNGGSTGPGVFALPKLYAASQTAYNLVVGDFNGDGKQDLLGVTSSSLPITTGALVFYGNGDGTLKPGEDSRSLPLAASPWATSMVMGSRIWPYRWSLPPIPSIPRYRFCWAAQAEPSPRALCYPWWQWPVRRLGTPDLYEQSILPAMAILILWSEPAF